LAVSTTYFIPSHQFIESTKRIGQIKLWNNLVGADCQEILAITHLRKLI